MHPQLPAWIRYPLEPAWDAGMMDNDHGGGNTMAKSTAGTVIPEGRSYVELQVSCVDDDGSPYKVPTVVYRWKH